MNTDGTKKKQIHIAKKTVSAIQGANPQAIRQIKISPSFTRKQMGELLDAIDILRDRLSSAIERKNHQQLRMPTVSTRRVA
jgi:hypothetical protein